MSALLRIECCNLQMELLSIMSEEVQHVEDGKQIWTSGDTCDHAIIRASVWSHCAVPARLCRPIWQALRALPHRLRPKPRPG